MVRRQAATNLAKFIKEMPASIVIDEMIPLFQHLVQDDQDSVRLLTVEILISIAEVVPKEQQASHGVLLTSLRNLIEDKSWRVRYMIADRFEKVCTWVQLPGRRSLIRATQIAKAVDEEVVSRDLVPAFVKLLKDNEAEVRTAIAGQLPGFCTLVDQSVLLGDIMSSIEDLVSDTSQHVRAALGTQISGLAPILGKQEYVLAKLWKIKELILLPGPLTTFCPCSCRCSRMSFRRLGSTSFPNLSLSTKVSCFNYRFLRNAWRIVLIRDSHWHRPAFSVFASCYRAAGRR